MGGFEGAKLLQWVARGHVACAMLDLKKHLFLWRQQTEDPYISISLTIAFADCFCGLLHKASLARMLVVVLRVQPLPVLATEVQ